MKPLEHPILISECQLKGQLDEAGVVDGRAYCAEAVGRRDGTRGIYGSESQVVIGAAELGVVEEVEELGSECQAHPFARQRDQFDDGKVGVDEVWADGRDARRVP